MKHLASIATFFIAACATITGAHGQEVYRCGSAYSQKPCPDAVVVNAQDPRTPAQKAESDANIRREAEAGNAMERARKKEEAELLAQQANTRPAHGKKGASKAKPSASDLGTDDTNTAQPKAPKRHAKKKKEPEFFTARGAAEKPKAKASASK